LRQKNGYDVNTFLEAFVVGHFNLATELLYEELLRVENTALSLD